MKTSAHGGVHFYVDDCVLQRLWNRPGRYLARLTEYECVLGPDFSMFVDLPLVFNLWNLMRNRYLACAMQQRGIPVIPSACWGSYDSLEYCFDGLPEGGVIAINHSVVGHSETQRQLYRAGVERLVATKRPDLLLVYGYQLTFDPGAICITIHWPKCCKTPSKAQVSPCGIGCVQLTTNMYITIEL